MAYNRCEARIILGANCQHVAPRLKVLVHVGIQRVEGFVVRQDGPAVYKDVHAVVRRADESEQQPVVRWQAAADLVRQLHDRQPGLEIGVLTRTNRAVARLLYELGPSRRRLRASGRGGGALTDAPAVNAVCDLLRLADHPDDTVAAFNVAGGPLGEVIRLTDHASATRRRRVARLLREQLLAASPRMAAWAFQELGEIRLRLGDLGAAEEACRKALELGRDPQPGLARLRLAQGDAKGALAAIDRALADPSQSENLANLLPAKVSIALAAKEAMAAATPIDDVRASAVYQMAMVRTLTLRGLRAVWGQLCST